MKCSSPRDLPSVSKLLEDPEVVKLSKFHGETLVKSAIRDTLSDSRKILLEGGSLESDSIVGRVIKLLEPAQKRVLNLTGTVLHTNLGRAPLGDLLSTVSERLQGYSILEYDLETGKRGKRGESVERLLKWTTGAPAALMVNNCSAAMVLLLTVLAKDKEVIVSRGELVEIGGSFRIPDILALSGAHLVEVGCTNRTRIDDYRRAIGQKTGLLLSTHCSNFEVVGFTESPSQEELIALGQEQGIPVVLDLGSGMLTRVVEKEPSVPDSAGFDLTAFSGDKLLGGPQCGILIGSEEFIERCRKHPFYRAFRCDKLTLALMEEVLRRHARQPETVPTLSLLMKSPEELRERAEGHLRIMVEFLPDELEGAVVDTESQVGGGSLPGGTLPSAAVCLIPRGTTKAQTWQKRFREASVPIICRVERDCLYLDFRSLPEGDDQEFAEAFKELFT